MAQIKCPNCGEVFTIDESSYEAILSQIKTSEFNKEVEERIHKELELNNKKKELEKQEMINDLQSNIAELNMRIKNAEQDKEQALKELKYQLTEELNAKNFELEKLRMEQQKEKENHNAQIELAKNEVEKANNQKISDLNETISKLEYDIVTLTSSNEVNLAHQKESYENKLKEKQIEVDYYKDLKARLSTKLVGETLEQHCQNEFNRLRSTAFPKAEFKKDNDSKSGSKGDYIYREFDDSGVEILSIMFEMKNENDTTSTKHKNEDFFKELDKDRKEKNCEYAVLVSMLEAESELYNSGIVDVSYEYPKMYVVRPQCFLSMIGILRNASMNALGYKRDLMIAKQQELDVTNFEDKLLDFQKRFGTNIENAKNRFNDAIDEIDKTINHLKAVKENLLTTSKHLGSANDKVQELSIKKLTYGNETMKEKFKEAENNKE